MKISKISLLFITILGINYFLSAQNTHKKYADQIILDSLKTHIEYLASGDLLGRDTGERGQKKAADYIASYFKEAGLSSPDLSVENPYYQPFGLYTYDMGQTSLWIDTLKIDRNLFFSSRQVKDSVNKDVIFIGNDTNTDQEGLDTKGKAVFFLEDDFAHSVEKAKQMAKDGQENFFIASFYYKMKKRIYVREMYDLSDMTHLQITYFYGATQMRPAEEFVNKAKESDVIPGMMIDSEKDIKLLILPEYLLKKLYGLDYKEIEKLVETNDKENDQSHSILHEKSIQLKIDYNPTIDTVITENVVGYIEGETDETVVLCAHYDHVGINKKGICYGADDNASGTGAVIECARQFGNAYKEGYKPKKNIVFIAFTGEELGLYGSNYYVDNPIFSNEKTSLCFNLDMIGRDRKDKKKYQNTVFVLGWENGKKYKGLSKKLNKGYTNLKVDATPGIFERLTWKFSSDHHAFLKAEVPVYTFFTGLHDDYHTTRDTPDKINYDKYTRIVRLSFATLWEVANDDNE